MCMKVVGVGEAGQDEKNSREDPRTVWGGSRSHGLGCASIRRDGDLHLSSPESCCEYVKNIAFYCALAI